MMAGAYVGLCIILIFSVGAKVDPAYRKLIMGTSFGIALISYWKKLPVSFSYYLLNNIAMITARIKETPFQKSTGLRSSSGARVLFRNALFG